MSLEREVKINFLFHFLPCFSLLQSLLLSLYGGVLQKKGRFSIAHVSLVQLRFRLGESWWTGECFLVCLKCEFALIKSSRKLVGRTASQSLWSSKTDAHGTLHECLFQVRGGTASLGEGYFREIFLLLAVSETTSCCLSFCFDFFFKHYRVGASCSSSLTHTSIRCVKAIYGSGFSFFPALKKSCASGVPTMCFSREVLA